MNEQLIVKNFGPIKDATVDFKRVTVFIGPTGGGKSTLAKLAAVFREKPLFTASTSKERQNILNENIYSYEIGNYARPGVSFIWRAYDGEKFDEVKASEEHVNVITNLKPQIGDKEGYVTEKLQGLIENSQLADDSELDSHEVYRLTQALSSEFDRLTMEWNKRRFPDILYIPADRLFVSAAQKELSSRFTNARFALGKPISDFLEAFNISKQRVTKFGLNFLDADFISDGLEVTINSRGSSLRLYESASGVQSVMPMASVILNRLYWNSNFNVPDTFSFIIEEPELNLYPVAQQGLLNWLVGRCAQNENDLTITTHSPYILSSCNLLLEAYKVAQQRPELADEVAAIVPRESWINPDEFAAYYVADGTVKPITDMRTHLIGSNELDAVSGDILDKFRELLRLKKQMA